MSDVCANCIDDEHISAWIVAADGEPGCSFCQQSDAPTADINELADFMRERMLLFYSHSIEFLLYDSSEGGYQGATWTTAEVLSEQIGLDFPRQSGSELLDALADAIDPDEPWCELDPAALDEDESLLTDWERFCGVVKHERRFFFHDVGSAREWWDDTQSARELFASILSFISQAALVRRKRPGYRLYRARQHEDGRRFTEAHDLGPPPPAAALQFNRMNPPGIPMFYGAEQHETAIAELRGAPSSVGFFTTNRGLRILDLVDLPTGRGIFSAYTQREVTAVAFLYRFSQIISQPIDRENRTVLDYIPTQVFTEYLRDASIGGRNIDGIRYSSAVLPITSRRTRGTNVVLFPPNDAVFVASGIDDGLGSQPLLSLRRVRQHLGRRDNARFVQG